MAPEMQLVQTMIEYYVSQQSFGEVEVQYILYNGTVMIEESVSYQQGVRIKLTVWMH